jgi:hypothetical protein
MNRSGLVARIVGGMSLILLSGSPAKASTVIPPTTCQAANPYVINQSGDYVLNSDLTCSDSTAIVVNVDNVTIRLKGFSIRCWAPPLTLHGDLTYKNSCQGSFYTGSDLGQHIKDCGVWTKGHSNVNIQGPGMIQGFGIGILLDGGGTVSCGSPGASPSPSPSASNVKVQRINVTGPDGRSDVSDPIAGPRPRSFGIIAVNFIENASTCSKWDSDDGHVHGNEIFGNSVDNYTEGIALYNASRVDVHENFVHDNNNAGDNSVSVAPATVCKDAFGNVITCPLLGTPVTTFESHGILVCANDPINPTRAFACTPGRSFRNKVRNNLIVDNGQNSCSGTGCSTTNNTPGPEDESTEQIDGGLSLIGVANKNDVNNNTVIGNNGDGISLRNGADKNRINSNSSLMNTSTDSPYCTGPNMPPNQGCTAAGQPIVPHFWDITFRGAGPNNIINSNNRCLTQTLDVPAGVCGAGQNTTWWQP